MKFLVLWHFDLTRLGPEVSRAVMQMPDYARKLGDKLECRYHVIGSHGGAWIYKVASNEELDRLLAMSPVYNYATYQVLVSRPGDLVSTNPLLRIGISPAERFC